MEISGGQKSVQIVEGARPNTPGAGFLYVILGFLVLTKRYNRYVRSQKNPHHGDYTCEVDNK